MKFWMNSLCVGILLVSGTNRLFADLVTNVTTEVANNDGAGFHDGPVIQAISGDLLETVGSIASASASPASGIAGQHLAASVLTGKIGIGVNDVNISDPEDTDAVFAAATGEHIEFDLDTTGASKGFNISSITLISRWTDPRSRQVWTLKFRPVGGSFSTFSTVTDSGINGRVVEVSITNDLGVAIAKGVDGIRIEFADAQYNWTAYREIDVVGGPTPSNGLMFFVR